MSCPIAFVFIPGVNKSFGYQLPIFFLVAGCVVKGVTVDSLLQPGITGYGKVS